LFDFPACFLALTINCDTVQFGLSRFGQIDGEDSILQFGGDTITLNFYRQLNRAFKVTTLAFLPTTCAAVRGCAVALTGDR